MNHTRLWPAVAAVALLPTLADAQAPALPTVSARGDHAFRHTLKMHGLVPLAGIEALKAIPADEAVLIILGDPGDPARPTELGRHLQQGWIRSFLDNGGAVLIATDQNTRGRIFGLRAAVTGAAVRIPDRVGPPILVWLRAPGGNMVMVNRPDYLKEKDGRYRNYTPVEAQLEFRDSIPIKVSEQVWERQQAVYFRYSDFILIKNHFGVPHRAFSGCDKGIVVNQPSFIVRGEDCEFAVLSSFPPFYTPDGGLVEVPAFAVGTNDPDARSRLLLLASYSQFWNSAYVQRETDNKAFMTNTIDWLVSGKKQRKFALYVFEGEVVTNFDVPLIDLPVPTRQMLNHLLRDMEEENFFNDFIAAEKPSVLRIALVLGVALLGLYGLQRYLRAHFRRDYTVPLLEAKQAYLAADDTPPLVRREQQRLRAGDFGEAARALARECFEAAGGGDAPPVVASGQSALVAAVATLWALAHGDGFAEPVSADAFGRIAALAELVREAFAQGRLRWEIPRA
jgi:hypothetical protein